LEDVALAMRVKAAGQRIWFISGKGLVRVRMYRSFPADVAGLDKKSLFAWSWAARHRPFFREMESNPPLDSVPVDPRRLKVRSCCSGRFLFLIARQISYGLDLARNHFPFSFIFITARRGAVCGSALGLLPEPL